MLKLVCCVRVRSQRQTRANPENVVYFRQMSRPERQRFEVSKSSRQKNSQKHKLSPKPKADVRKYKRSGRSHNQETKSKVENQDKINRQGLGRLVNKNKGCRRESQ